jgi:hypothetical protein
MEETKTNPVLDQAMEILNGLVFPALREGGLEINRDEAVFALALDMWAGDARRLMLIDLKNEHGNQLFASLVVPPEEDPKDPKVVKICVGVSSVNEGRSAGILFTRRTDESWRESHIGAHDVLPLDDRQAFQAIMKATRLHRHSTL